MLSPLIVQHFGWRALFYIFGLAGAPLLALWFSVVPPPQQQPQQAGAGTGGAKVGAAAAAFHLIFTWPGLSFDCCP